jgi:hypothetical protein
MNDKTTPLYVVCSPCRGVGKTLVSRLLTEFYVLHGRPVAAYDLADEGPQLADYLPQFTTICDIGDIFGQMAFFERLIADNDRIFTVVEEIGFFEEARRRPRHRAAHSLHHRSGSEIPRPMRVCTG